MTVASGTMPIDPKVGTGTSLAQNANVTRAAGQTTLFPASDDEPTLDRWLIIGMRVAVDP